MRWQSDESLVRHKSQLGITLVEAMVVIAIIAILAAIAIPSYQDYILRQKWKGAAEAVYGSIQLAKRAAISNNDTVYFIVSGAGSTGWITTFSASTALGISPCIGGYVAVVQNCSAVVDGNLYDTIVLNAPSGGVISFEMPEMISSNPQSITITSSLGDYTIAVSSDMKIEISP